eukprot:1159076-Pelagomonas_calceolata.AAC.1
MQTNVLQGPQGLRVHFDAATAISFAGMTPESTINAMLQLMWHARFKLAQNLFPQPTCVLAMRAASFPTSPPPTLPTFVALLPLPPAPLPRPRFVPPCCAWQC